MALASQTLRTLSLDLDNTLWDVDPVIEAAERRLKDWLAAECPRAVAHYQPERVLGLRREIAALHPERDHDLTFLRKAVLEQVLVGAGYPGDLAEAAFAVFFAARNEVTLFADVLPALERLSQHFELVALTDGNADLAAIGLDAFFSHYINAAGVGRAKPHAAMFTAVAAATGHDPTEIVHVGDHPEKDVAGARRCGLRAVWVNRQNHPWPLDHAAPDAEVTDLAVLVEQLVP
jgi:HAD superfamily hydrolase (TIGR01549 family)